MEHPAPVECEHSLLFGKLVAKRVRLNQLGIRNGFQKYGWYFLWTMGSEKKRGVENQRRLGENLGKKRKLRGKKAVSEQQQGNRKCENE